MTVFAKFQHFQFIFDATFSTETFQSNMFLGNDYKNEIKDNPMLKYRLQCEDYWMKTLRTVYIYSLNERTKFINKNVPSGKPLSPLPRYGEHVTVTRAWSKIKVIMTYHLKLKIHSIFKTSFS